MFTLTHLDTPPPESLKSQVLQMVVDYLGDISPVSLQPSNPLYQLYQYVVGFEVHRYLDSMDGAQAGKPELIMALNAEDPAVLLGFALYLPFMDDPRHRPGHDRGDGDALSPCGGGVRCRQGAVFQRTGLSAAGVAWPAGGDEYP